MKLKIVGILLALICQSILAQTASAYFPSQAGYKWSYESIPLDSLNNPVNSQKFFSIDSFAVVTPFNGKNSNVVLSKTGPEITINFQPFLDTSYYSFESSNGFEYFDPKSVYDLLGNVDTTLGINFINFFNSLEGWYPYYRFASANNVEYQVFKKDTAVTVNSVAATIRFELIGKKLADETINTAIGNFLCKKFVMEVRISYLLLNIFPVKLFGVEDSLWFAPDNWKVRSFIPATNVDLSILGIPAFYIPGLETNIITPITNLGSEINAINNFELYQNYPNPFNPSTIIQYALGSREFVQLKVFDVLGNELATLVDEEKPAGNYEVEFTVSKFADGRSRPAIASGVYYYQLKVGNLTQSKKMILIK
ncbi:MAG TPA: T9SS type A sorting domain-containing protein [Ignavibacteriaceae bacterium]